MARAKILPSSIRRACASFHCGDQERFGSAGQITVAPGVGGTQGAQQSELAFAEIQNDLHNRRL
jgi:hypothetical protein